MPVSRVEINRKLIHLSSLWMPLAIYFFDQKTSLILFGTLFILAAVAQILRRLSPKFHELSNNIFASAQRPGEKDAKAVAGATYMLLGVLFTFLFAKEIALTAVLVLIVSDTAAALIGQAFGKRPLLDKSVEGCVAFLMSGLCVVVGVEQILQPEGAFFWAGVLAVLMATLTELFSRRLRVDDNLSIPFVICMTMWLLQ